MRLIRYVCLPIVLLLLSLPAYASLITFSSLGTFTAAAPGLPVETFESGLVAPGGVTICTGPLSSGAASPCFPLSGLLPGVTYSSITDPLMVVLGPGVAGNTSKVLGPNSFVSTFNLTFTSANAIGFDVFPGPNAGSIVISLFNPADVALGSFTVPGVVGGSFFGVVSTSDLVGRVNIASQAPTPGELVDNLRFGTVSAVPEPSSLLLLAVGVSAIVCCRRKRILRG